MQRIVGNAGNVVHAEMYEEAKGGGWAVVFDTEYAALKAFYKYRGSPGLRFGKSPQGWYISTTSSTERPRGGVHEARRVRENGDDEPEVWIDSDNEAPWLAQHWYSGQGDPLYALSSTGFPQPESTISWALSNAKASEAEQWKHMEKTYGKKGAQKLMAIDPESREARALPDEKREDLEATDEIGRLVWALQEALKQGERISAEEGLQRQGVAPGTRW
jgi:hypothetical protein